MAQAGFDVHLLAVADRTESESGVVIEALPRRNGRLRRMTLGPLDAWRRLRRIQPQMIHVHDPELIPMAILWKLRTGRPAVFDAHEDLVKQIAGKTYIPMAIRPMIGNFGGLIERLADNLLSAVVVATPAIARKFHRAQVALVQNFPWLREYPEPTEAPESADLALCYVGGLSRGRGGLDMVSVVQKAPTVRLVVAGPVTPEVANVIKADKTGRIDYRGTLPADEVPEVIRQSTAGLALLHPLPNYLESQPTKIFEYMASSRPFIASNFDSWRRLLERYDCGYFVDPFDHDAITDIFGRIAANPREAVEKGVRGRRALIDAFTFESESSELIALTARLLGTVLPGRSSLCNENQDNA